MLQQIKRHFGQILLDGGFLSRQKLDFALEEQKRTNELLGQVLVRMGVLSTRDVKVPLLVQGHLSSIDDAVKVAAGERQLLGTLLVQSGKITSKQLDYAIVEQKRNGEKLGEVFVRLGMLTERQLNALLDFQLNQSHSLTSPLRLGELLIETGHITREELEAALNKQAKSHKKLGEVLVEEGYVRPSQITHGIRLQKMLMKSSLAALLSICVSATSYASTVALQWDASTDPGIAGYKVYYQADSSVQPFTGTGATVGNSPVDAHSLTSATISGLDPAHAYYFAVTAYTTSGAESAYSNIVYVPELVSPVVAISAPANSATVSGTVSVTANASDNVGVTKTEFYVNGVLQATDTASPYTYSWNTSSLASGVYTLMVMAYDAAGNVGQSSTVSVTVNSTIPDTIVPLVSTFVMPTTANSLTVAISSFTASDNVAVTGYLVTKNSTKPTAGASGWSTSAPTSFTFSSAGSKIAYAWVKDAAGNISASRSVTVNIDTAAPVVSAFTMPSTSTSLTVSVPSFTASDASGVTGFMITENSSPPAANAPGWTVSAPTSFTFSSAGSKTAYAWAKDSAGNISASASASTSITLSYPLTLAFAGTGDGSVHGDITCSNGASCPSISFVSGSVEVLIPTPSSNSIFVGWSGDCSNVVGNCSVTMDGSKSVTATFDVMPVAWIPPSTAASNYFGLISDSYTAAANGATIKAMVHTFTENLTLNRGIAITFIGGYNAGYVSNSGNYTTLDGALTIQSGSLVVENLIVE